MTKKSKTRIVHNDKVAWEIPIDAPTPVGCFPGRGPFTVKGRRTVWTVWISDGKKYCTQKNTDPVPDGWHVVQRPNSTRNHVRINNGLSETSIPSSSVIPEGWVRGRLSYKTGTQYWFTDGVSNVKAPMLNDLPPSFRRGRTESKARKPTPINHSIFLKEATVDGFKMLVPFTMEVVEPVPSETDTTLAPATSTLSSTLSKVVGMFRAIIGKTPIEKPKK